MWNVKARVIPIVIGPTGNISKSFRHYLGNQLGEQEIKDLQKMIIMGTAHILRKVKSVSSPITGLCRPRGF